MTPADTPSPRPLSEEERALWEKAAASQCFPGDESWLSVEFFKGIGLLPRFAELTAACSPAVILSLLTALASEREAGEMAIREWWDNGRASESAMEALAKAINRRPAR